MSGELVLCLVIILGVRKDLSVETRVGPDTITTGHVTNEDFFRRISIQVPYRMLTRLYIRNKEIQCMVRLLPNGSTTSPILTKYHALIYSFNVTEMVYIHSSY